MVRLGMGNGSDTSNCILITHESGLLVHQLREQPFQLFNLNAVLERNWCGIPARDLRPRSQVWTRTGAGSSE